MPSFTGAKTPITILVVDDEPEIRSILRRGFEAEGYVVAEAGGKTSMLRTLETTPIALITLDLNLAGDDGLYLAREIRSKRNVPIIMVTGRDAPVDRLAGLEHGADDYIAKPFLIREVLLRVRTVLRRYELERPARDDDGSARADRFEFAAGVLDAPRREVTAPDGRRLDLTDAEFDLLALFLRWPTRVLSRDEIMRMLRGQSWSPLDRTLDGHVARLRKKIEPQSDAPRLIKSVRGVGYVFTGDVRRS
jgi:two-component system, OmpR family, response regulator